MSSLQLQDVRTDSKDAQVHDPNVEENDKEEHVLPKEDINAKESEN